MSKARHKAGGGALETAEPDKDVYAGGSSPVAKVAEKKKSGGAVGRRSGGKVEGEKHAHKMRLHRKSGGRTMGSDQHPLTSAANGKDAEGHKTDEADDGP